MEKNTKKEELIDFGKNIVQRHIHEGKLNLANALIELDSRIAALEEAMSFFSNWYNKTQRTEILIPENLKKDV